MHIPGISCMKLTLSPSHLEKCPKFVSLQLFLFLKSYIKLFLPESYASDCIAECCVLGGSQNEFGLMLYLCCRKKLFWCVQSFNVTLAKSQIHLAWGFVWEKCEQKHHVESSDKYQEFWEHDLERLNHRTSSSCLARRDWRRHCLTFPSSENLPFWLKNCRLQVSCRLLLGPLFLVPMTLEDNWK